MMRIVCWNIRRAKASHAGTWGYLEELDPDLALLQEVGEIPGSFLEQRVSLMRSASSRDGRLQRFSTGILVKGEVVREIDLSSAWAWVNGELERFRGNLIAAEIALLNGERLHVCSAYSPAWPIPRERLAGVDLSPVKLSLNRDLFVTELLWAALRELPVSNTPWIVGGDLNSSVTFDHLWKGGPRGNQEIQDRMESLGFVECLRSYQEGLTPTFRNSRDGKVIHQIDHLFVSAAIAQSLAACRTGDHDRVFGSKLSDHLPIVADFDLGGSR